MNFRIHHGVQAAVCGALALAPMLARSSTSAEMAEVLIDSQLSMSVAFVQFFNPAVGTKLDFDNVALPSGDAAGYQLSANSQFAGIKSITGGMLATPEPGKFWLSGGIEATTPDASVGLSGEATVQAIGFDGTGKVDQDVVVELPPGSGLKWKMTSYTALKAFTANGQIASDTTLTFVKVGDDGRTKQASATDTFNVATRKYELHMDLGDGKRLDIAGVMPNFGGGVGGFTLTVSQVPEPSALWLALAGLGVVAWRPAGKRGQKPGV